MEPKKIAFLIIVIVIFLSLFGLFLYNYCFVKPPVNKAIVLSKKNRICRVVMNKRSFVPPFFYKIAYVVDLNPRNILLEDFVELKNKQTFSYKLTFFYSIGDPLLFALSFEENNHLLNKIKDDLKNTIKIHAFNLSTNNQLTIDFYKSQILKEVNDSVSNYGISVLDIKLNSNF